VLDMEVQTAAATGLPVHRVIQSSLLPDGLDERRRAADAVVGSGR